MQTALTTTVKATALGQTAEQILRRCVHCGFCTAVCPTYQLTGDELDGPRGRIYLIKQVLEGQTATHITQHHLDRCLACLACEANCPSGVNYHQLLAIGRQQVEQRVKRPFLQRQLRRTLGYWISNNAYFKTLVTLGRLARPLLPPPLKRQLPKQRPRPIQSQRTQTRKLLLLEGCVQPHLAAEVNQATANVLARLKIQLLPVAGCCGAIHHHLSDVEQTKQRMRHNIDNWWPWVEQGVEAILVNASACVAMLKNYHTLLNDEPDYQAKAQRIVALVKDMAEIVTAEDISVFRPTPQKIAFHAPCSLQHDLKQANLVTTLLTRLGFELVPVSNAHLCCGAAGTYMLTQRHLSQQLLAEKLTALQHHQPTLIATANVGCLLHLKSQAQVPVKHWIELLVPEGCKT